MIGLVPSRFEPEHAFYENIRSLQVIVPFTTTVGKSVGASQFQILCELVLPPTE